MVHYNTTNESNWQSNWQWTISRWKLQRIGKMKHGNSIKLKQVGGVYYMTISDSLYQAERQERYSQTALALAADDVFLNLFFFLLFSSSFLHILNQASQQQYVPKIIPMVITATCQLLAVLARESSSQFEGSMKNIRDWTSIDGWDIIIPFHLI